MFERVRDKLMKHQLSRGVIVLSTFEIRYSEIGLIFDTSSCWEEVHKFRNVRIKSFLKVKSLRNPKEYAAKIEKTLRKADTLRNNGKDFEMSYHDM